MSGEQFKAADADAAKEDDEVVDEEAVEEISEEDLKGVTGGGRIKFRSSQSKNST